ncbi:nuclear transport factor 2 family protein [Palleronia rufa]|uniref:nuclear transport factor 2 family protein n=1 Tax=Palleronia rufa TaxID=1530186 RepID=UPI00055A92B7|nr:nuclear transport factor 2 family protein [Palleronia rufa]
MTADLQDAKRVVREFYAAIDGAEDTALAPSMERHCAPDLLWRGCHPFGELRGPHLVAERFWRPLKASLRPMRRRLDLFFAGRNEIDGFASVWVASMGHLMGLFDAVWLGIPPTGRVAMLRYAAFHRVANGRIAETAMIFDVPHLMMQAGLRPFPPSTAAELVQPGPMTHEGLMFGPQDAAEGDRTLAAIDFMVGDVATWKDPGQMSLTDELRCSWTEDMIWWGPGGIGATYTIERYAAQHSGPFRAAFADRRFNGHLCRMAEGRFGGFFGWPNLTLTPTGGFMGMPATGRAGDMRVVDMYRREGDKLAENWVFIDLLHFWDQQGLDVLERMTELSAGR